MTTISGLAKRWRQWTAVPLAATVALLVLVTVSCGRKSGVAAVREQVATTALAPAATATDASGPVAAGPATLGTAYARFLDQPNWSEEALEPLNFVVVRGTVRGTGDKFEGWFIVGGAAPVLHHFMLNGQSHPAERFAAYAGAAALRQALR
jgi:hypothetical protein